jgi:hypothetical protein
MHYELEKTKFNMWPRVKTCGHFPGVVNYSKMNILL